MHVSLTGYSFVRGPIRKQSYSVFHSIVHLWFFQTKMNPRSWSRNATLTNISALDSFEMKRMPLKFVKNIFRWLEMVSNLELFHFSMFHLIRQLLYLVLLQKMTGIRTSLAFNLIATEDIITFKDFLLLLFFFEKLKRPRVRSNLKYSVTNGHS